MGKIRELHVSQVKTYKTCPRMYRYQYVDKLQPVNESDKLALGTLVHRGIGAYYRNEDPIRVYDNAVNEKLDQLYRRGAFPDAVLKIKEAAALGKAMLEGYVEFARENDNFTMQAIELPFSVPIRHPVTGRALGAYHVGTLDGVAIDVWGRHWLKEFKTAKNFFSESYLRLDEQAGFYLLAATELFPDWGFVGVIYTVIRKQDPKTAKTDTIRRSKVLRNAYELQGLRERLYWAWRRMQNDRIYSPSPGLHCTWQCGYMPLCMAQEDGSSVSDLIESLYVYAEPYQDQEEEVS